MATKLVKEYLRSAVFTDGAIVVWLMLLAPWLTSTIEKVVGSVETDVHSIVLVPEKSHCAPAVGWVIVIAETVAAKTVAKPKMVLASIFDVFRWNCDLID